MNKLTLGGAVAAMLVTQPAIANETYPHLSGSIDVTVQDDKVFNASDNSDGNDLYLTVESATQLHLTDSFRVEAGLTFEPVQDRLAGDDRTFDDHGLYVDTLHMVFERDNYMINAGKFTAPFGLAHDVVPGLYGDTFTESYELTERLGAGVGLSLPVEGVATVALSAALFKLDTSVFSRSAVTDRGRLHRNDGGLGNTSGLENYSATLDVTDIDALPGLILRASYLRQGEGVGDTEDATAWGLGAAFEHEVAEGFTLTPMIEYVRSEDAIGINEATSVPGGSQSYLTAGIGIGHGRGAQPSPAASARTSPRPMRMSTTTSFRSRLAMNSKTASASRPDGSALMKTASTPTPLESR